jgi:hypothetical protein
MRTRLVIALSLGVTLAALIFALGATASSLPAQPAPISSPCLSVTVAPHVVSVGGNVIARTGAGTGGCTHSQLEWSWFVNGEKSTTCGTSSTSCEIKATRPTNGYRPICAIGTGTSAGIQACDYVAVTAAGTFTVSGQLTARSPLIKRLARDTPTLANVANAKVEAIGADGESTVATTAADGSYSLSVPRGRYTITVDPAYGADARGATSPGTRTIVVSGNIEHVDFALGRVMHLQGELTEEGSAVHHKLRLSMSFLRRGKLVGSAGNVVCTATVCSGRAVIGGALEDSWIYVKWPFTAGADRGTGFVTSERVARDGDGEPNFPSAANQYEGSIVVHTRLQFGSVLHRRFSITITLI